MLTKRQEEVLAQLKGGETTQMAYWPPLMQVIRNLGKLGLVEWRHSGGWIAVAPKGTCADEPGEHILRRDLETVVSCLKQHNGFARDDWELLEWLGGQLSYSAMQQALSYGHRKEAVNAACAHYGDYSGKYVRNITLHTK